MRNVPEPLRLAFRAFAYSKIRQEEYKAAKVTARSTRTKWILSIAWKRSEES